MFYVLEVRDSYGFVEAVEANEESVNGERKTLRENYASDDGYRIKTHKFNTAAEMAACWDKLNERA